jgi:hypothetical protein
MKRFVRRDRVGRGVGGPESIPVLGLAWVDIDGNVWPTFEGAPAVDDMVLPDPFDPIPEAIDGEANAV